MEYVLGLISGLTLARWIADQRRRNEAAEQPKEPARSSTSQRLSITWEDLQEADDAVAAVKKELKITGGEQGK